MSGFSEGIGTRVYILSILHARAVRKDYICTRANCVCRRYTIFQRRRRGGIIENIYLALDEWRKRARTFGKITSRVSSSSVSRYSVHKMPSIRPVQPCGARYRRRVFGLALIRLS